MLADARNESVAETKEQQYQISQLDVFCGTVSYFDLNNSSVESNLLQFWNPGLFVDATTPFKY